MLAKTIGKAKEQLPGYPMQNFIIIRGINLAV